MDATNTSKINNFKTLKLIVESELGFGDEYSINNNKRIIIGRGEKANIQLFSDNLASREHCEIYFENMHFVIHDLGSSNGTQLNNKDIDTVQIKSNDAICVGTTLFRTKIEVQAADEETEQKIENSVPNSQAVKHESKNANALDTASTLESSNVSAPENEATIAFQISQEAQPKEPFSLFSDEEDSLPFVKNDSSFKVSVLLWQDLHGTSKLSIIAKNTFKMLPGKEVQLSDKSIPLFKQTHFYDDKDDGSILYESDLVPFKPLADIVVVGKAHTPNKKSQQILDVGLQVGKTKKIIKVFGDRFWYQADEDGDFVISEPQPFTTMTLKYEKSYGGNDLDNDIYNRKNPIGRGCISEESLQNSEFRKLPNIENPQDLFESWNSRPDPVGLGFYANNWEPRFQYLGSYDDETLEDDQLGLPKNFNDRFYNSAHPDLQVEAYLEGNEKVELVNLSSKGRLIFNLPNIKPEVVVSKKNFNVEDANDEKCDETHIKMNLDTLVFIPEEEVFYQVFRGVYELDSMQDIQTLSVLVS